MNNDAMKYEDPNRYAPKPEYKVEYSSPDSVDLNELQSLIGHLVNQFNIGKLIVEDNPNCKIVELMYTPGEIASMQRFLDKHFRY